MNFIHGISSSLPLQGGSCASPKEAGRLGKSPMEIQKFHGESLFRFHSSWSMFVRERIHCLYFIGCPSCGWYVWLGGVLLLVFQPYFYLLILLRGSQSVQWNLMLSQAALISEIFTRGKSARFKREHAMGEQQQPAPVPVAQIHSAPSTLRL